ncbi:MAG: sigma-70 family RNA polymerase sigma factor, partial [Verrucomicrobiota bacterium]
SRLSTQDRNILFLHYYEGHTFEEVGRLLGIRQRAAQKRVQRAVGKLRNRLSLAGCSLAPVMVGTALFVARDAEPSPGLAATIKQQALLEGGQLAAGGILSTFGFLKIGIGLIAATAVAIPFVQNPSSGTSVPTGNEITMGRTLESSPTGRQSNQVPGQTFEIDDIEAIYRLEDLEKKAAISRLTAYLKDQREPSYLTNLFSRWTNLDPEELARTLVSLYRSPLDPEHETFLGDAFAIPLDRWVRKDPEGAQAWVAGLPRTDYAETRAFEALINAQAAIDLSRAYALLADRPFNRKQTIARLAGRVTERLTVTEALQWWEALPEDEEIRLESLVHGVSAYLHEAGSTKAALGKGLIPGLYEKGPQRLADGLIDLPASPETSALIAGFVEQWAADDPRSAAEWVGTLEPGEQRVSAQALAASWSLTEAPEAYAWMASLPESLRWEAMESATASRLAGGVPATQLQSELADWQNNEKAETAHALVADELTGPEALGWALDMDARSTNRPTVLARAFFSLGRDAADEGRRALRKLSTKERESVLYYLSLGWITGKERKGFRDWVKEFPADSMDYYRIVSAEVDLLAAINPDGAARRVFGFPEGEGRDLPLSRLLERTLYRSPSHAEKALDWTHGLSNKQTRQAMEARIATVIDRSNSDAGKALPEGKVPDFQNQSLTQLLERLDIMASVPRRTEP